MTPYRGACTGSEPPGHRSWEVESPRMDGSYQEEEGSSSVFTSSTSWSKFLISLVRGQVGSYPKHLPLGGLEALEDCSDTTSNYSYDNRSRWTSAFVTSPQYQQ